MNCKKVLLFNESTSQKIEVHENEQLEIVVLQFGDQNYSDCITVNLVGENAEVLVRGLYFATGGQWIENKIEIKHFAKNCQSDVLFKGVISEKGTKTNWIGNVRIEASAKGTKTYEENRNLLLNRGCQALSEPNLEIMTGDIESAGHASSTGRFDDEQLFYLMSRGISKDEARRLVVEGFFRSVLDVIELDEDLLRVIFERIDSNLKHSE